MTCSWIEGPAPRIRCCEYGNQPMRCTDAACIEFNDGAMNWHAAFYCPSCRGEGEPVESSS